MKKHLGILQLGNRLNTNQFRFPFTIILKTKFVFKKSAPKETLIHFFDALMDSGKPKYFPIRVFAKSKPV